MLTATRNVLAGPQVVEAFAEGLHDNEDDILDERLMHAVECGRDAGGQPEGQLSASILTFGHHSKSRCDLRVDVSEDPVKELRRIFDWFWPLLPNFEQRMRDPNVPRLKEYFKQLGLEREYVNTVPVTCGGSTKFLYRP